MSRGYRVFSSLAVNEQATGPKPPPPEFLGIRSALKQADANGRQCSTPEPRFFASGFAGDISLRPATGARDRYSINCLRDIGSAVVGRHAHARCAARSTESAFRDLVRSCFAVIDGGRSS